MDNYIPKPFRAEILKEVLELAANSMDERPQSPSEARGGDFAKRLQALDSEDREDVLAAAPMFLKAFPKDALKLQNAVIQLDFKECYFLAHTMKGVSGIFGCEVCMSLAEKVEAACRDENKENLISSAKALLEAMRALASEVEFSAI